MIQVLYREAVVRAAMPPGEIPFDDLLGNQLSFFPQTGVLRHGGGGNPGLAFFSLAPIKAPDGSVLGHDRARLERA